jgi:peptide deformylase
MAKLKIETGDDNEILRSVSDVIKPAELKQYRALADSMIKHIKNPDNGGVGLAAPQVGVNKRLIVVSLIKTYDDETYRTIAMVNPEITEHAEHKLSWEEWCLSVPGETGDVERWEWVKVSFIDPEGRKYAMRLEWLSARIVQHEIDHLDGVLFTDIADNIQFNTDTNE